VTDLISTSRTSW